MKIILTLGICLIQLIGFTQINEKTRFEMFCSAINNFSTSPNYVVINVKNLNTGEVKEICTEAPFIRGALGHETGNWTLNCESYKTRQFEFSKDSSLMNIGFDNYTKKELEIYSKTINVSEIVNQVKSGKLTSKTFQGDKKEQLMFAHLMYNNGIMMKRGCLAGNICSLSYFKS
jgi:hypothetical protein